MNKQWITLNIFCGFFLGGEQYYLFSVYTESYITLEGVGGSSLKSFTQHFPFLPTSPHQLPSASTTLVPTLLSHHFDAPASLPLPPPPRSTPVLPCYLISLPFLPAFPSFSLFHSLRSLPASPSALLWTWPWICAPRGLSLGIWFDLWLGKCFEESWEEPGAWAGVFRLDLLSAQNMEETGALSMPHILNWQCSPVLTEW